MSVLARSYVNGCGLHDSYSMNLRVHLALLTAIGIVHSVFVTAFFSPGNVPLAPISSPTRSSLTTATPYHYGLKMLTVAKADSTVSESGEEKTSIVVIGLNGALQRMVEFAPPKGLKIGGVNRAASVGTGIGGKGQNVCVALRLLAERSNGDVDVTLAHFAGGKSGSRVL